MNYTYFMQFTEQIHSSLFLSINEALCLHNLKEVYLINAQHTTVQVSLESEVI